MPIATRRQVLGALATLIGTNATAGTLPAEETAPVEQLVLRAFIKFLDGFRKPGSKDFAFAPFTETYPGSQPGATADVDSLMSLIPRMTRAVAQDFLRVNSSSVPVVLPVTPGRKASPTIVNAETLSRLFHKPHGWERFYEEFPERACLIRISRVGIDERAGQALICDSISSGMLSGGTDLVLLDRKNGVWAVAEQKLLAIS